MSIYIYIYSSQWLKYNDIKENTIYVARYTTHLWA